MYVLLAVMGFCLYNTMRKNPGYVPRNTDLTAAKRVCVIFMHVCMQFVVVILEI